MQLIERIKNARSMYEVWATVIQYEARYKIFFQAWEMNKRHSKEFLASRLYRNKLLIRRLVRKARSAETHVLAIPMENGNGCWMKCALRDMLLRIDSEGSMHRGEKRYSSQLPVLTNSNSWPYHSQPFACRCSNIEQCLPLTLKADTE